MPLSRLSGKRKLQLSKLIGDAFLYGSICCVTTMSAALPFYVHFHQSEFGPPRMRFYGAEEDNLVRERQMVTVLKPLLELDKITTSSIQRDLSNARATSSEAQAFPDEIPAAATKLEIMFVSNGRLLAMDAGRVLSLKVGDTLSDGSTIRSISQSQTGWDVKTSSGTLLSWPVPRQ